MLEEYYFKILGLSGNENIEEAKKVYRNLVKKNHPDLFDESKQTVQSIKMAQINEAFIRVKDIIKDKKENKTNKKPIKHSNSEKDPAYKNYRKGYDYFSAAINRTHPESQAVMDDNLNLRWQVGAVSNDEIIEVYKTAFKNLRLAETAFSYVLTNFSQSPWANDSREKIKEIARFYLIYQKIINNMI